MTYPASAQDEASEVHIRWQLPVVQKDEVLSLLAEALIAAHRDVMLGGVVIDACDGELAIRNDQGLPGEMVVVRCGDDVETWRARNPTSSELVTTLVETLKQTPKKAK